MERDVFLNSLRDKKIKTIVPTNIIKPLRRYPRIILDTSFAFVSKIEATISVEIKEPKVIEKYALNAIINDNNAVKTIPKGFLILENKNIKTMIDNASNIDDLLKESFIVLEAT